MKINRLLSLLILAFMQLLLPLSSLAAEPFEKRVGWVRTPILYCTERMLNLNSSETVYQNAVGEKLSFGCKYLPVPLPAARAADVDALKVSGHYKMLGNMDSGPASLFIPPEFEPFKSRTLTEAELFNEALRLESLSGGLIVFVHGCCADFESSMQKAGNLAIWTKQPVLMYDWYSPKGLDKYLANEQRYEQAKDGFFAFMDGLEKAVPAENITLIAHSMGNRFLDSYLVRRSEIQQGQDVKAFHATNFVAADVDAQAFANHEKVIARVGGPVKIFVSDKDEALMISGSARYARLGNPGAILKKLSSCECADLLDVRAAGTGHDMPFWFIGEVFTDGGLHLPGFKLVKRGPRYFCLARGK